MQVEWLQKENRDKVVVFFAGWGADVNPFLHLSSNENDILFCYDLSGIRELDLSQLLESYKTVVGIGWSMGVWGLSEAAKCFTFDRLFAINGTPYPVSNEHGINPRIFSATLNSLSSQSLLKFVRRMCNDSSILSQYLTCSPKRELSNILNELQFIDEEIKKGVDKPSRFDVALIGSNDRIFPFDSQFAYWNGRSSVLEKDYTHFPFFAFKSWDQLIQLFERGLH